MVSAFKSATETQQFRPAFCLPTPHCNECDTLTQKLKVSMVWIQSICLFFVEGQLWFRDFQLVKLSLCKFSVKQMSSLQRCLWRTFKEADSCQMYPISRGLWQHVEAWSREREREPQEEAVWITVRWYVGVLQCKHKHVYSDANPTELRQKWS